MIIEWKNIYHKQVGDTLYFVKFHCNGYKREITYREGIKKIVTITKVCDNGYYVEDRDKHKMFVETDTYDCYHGINILLVKDRPNCFIFESEKEYLSYVKNTKSLKRLQSIVNNLSCTTKKGIDLIYLLLDTCDTYLYNTKDL